MKQEFAQKFDCIVIGSGLGGLTAGALCARAGLRVLILERNDNFGGAASVYRHNGLAIEASLHEIDGFDEDDPKLGLIQSLGLDEDLQFTDVGDLYEVRGGIVGAPFTLPHDCAAALAAAVARFPKHKAGLEEYFRRLTTLRGAVSFAHRHRDDGAWWLTHAPEVVRKLMPLLRNGNATLGQVMDDLFGTDEAVKIALAANLGYYHDDPERMLFLRFAIPQASFLAGGGHYVRGGSQALTDKLVSLIEKAGGTLTSGREADELVIENGRIAGVGHHARNGGARRIDAAPLVFGNAAPQVLATMLPEALRATFLAPYAKRRASISLWTLSLGISRPAREFGVSSYSTFIIPDWMKSLADMRDCGALMGEPPGTRLPSYVFVDFHQIDSGLNRTPPHLVSFCGVDRLENWVQLDPAAKKQRKQAWTQALIADIDKHFPGIAATIVHHELATAETMQQYLNTPGGSVYGFAPEGTLGDTMKLGPRTAIEGLWLASAFAGSGGFTGSMLGGGTAASQALKGALRSTKLGKPAKGEALPTELP